MAAPAVDNVGTGATDTGGTWTTGSITADNTGDLVILHVVQDGSTASAISITSTTNIVALDGTANTMTAVGTSSGFSMGGGTAFHYVWLGRSTGGAIANLAVVGGNSGTDDLYTRLYTVTGASTGTTLATVIENGSGTSSSTNGTSATATAPTIETMGADRLLMLFTGVNDDNAAAAPTSPITWTTPTAYAESSGTDGAVILHYITRTTAAVYTPGNYSITDSDAWGVVGFAVIPVSGNISVTPTTLALADDEYAPVIAHGINAASPTALVLATFAPTAQLGVNLVPTTTATTLATFAPTVTTTNHQLLTPDIATLATAAFAPTVTASDHQSVTPTTTAIAISLFVPDVTVGASQNVVPTTASVVLTTYAPTASLGETLTPGRRSLVTRRSWRPSVLVNPAAVVVTPPPARLGINAQRLEIGASTTLLGTVTSNNVSFATARAGSSLSDIDDDTWVSLSDWGGDGSGPFNIEASYLTFDTSTLVGGTVLMAELRVFVDYLSFNASGPRPVFTVQVRLYDWGTSVTTADWVAGDTLAGLPLLAHFDATEAYTLYPAGLDTVLDDLAANITPGTALRTIWSVAGLATNDPPDLGDLGIYAEQAMGVAKTPDEPLLTVVAAFAAGYPPTVTVEGGSLVEPTTAALTLTTFAPSVGNPVNLVPATAGATLTAFAPDVAATAHQTVTPTTTAVLLATFAPNIGGNQNFVPTTATLSVATFTPTVATPQTFTPTTTALTLATFAPDVTATAHQAVTPTTAAVVLATFAPNIGGNQNFVPTTTALTLTTFAPTVTVPSPQLVTPDTASLILTRYEPSVGNPVQVTPTTPALTTATFAPVVSTTAHQTITPDTIALALSPFSANVLTSSHQTVTPTTAGLTINGYIAIVVATGAGTKVEEMMDGIKAALAAYGMTVYAYPASAVVVPCIIVGYPSQVSYDFAMQNAADTFVVDVWVVGGREKAAFTLLGEALMGDNDLKGYIDGQYAWGSARVTNANVETLDIGSIVYTAGRLEVEVVK